MERPKYSIAKDQFVIDNYNQAPTFSSFFPGIAGTFGCPMWVFYCNRGQAITSCGVQDKDGAIMEFQPANKAYRMVSQTGFRTFIKVDGQSYEPFKDGSKMEISAHDLTLEEENKKLKIRVKVNYFTIPNEPFSGLARSVTITNLSTKKRKLEVVDGLPNIVPCGFVDDLLKRLSTTIEAWCIAENLENGAPFFHLKVCPADVAETKCIDKGNYYIPFSPQVEPNIIIDPKVVFGENTSFELPEKFLSKKFKIPPTQVDRGITPAAMAYNKINLAKNESFELFSVIGQCDSLLLLQKIKATVSSKEYLSKKSAENKTLIDSICDNVQTKSSSNNFDLYTKQTFLDNAMRGGFPIDVDHKVLYTYYRKHGDMERDYNNFRLNPTFFSQGNGNYRDVNQNRRCDIFFNPKAGEDNIIRFFNLIQLDGYNPLVVLGSRFCLKSAKTATTLLNKHLEIEADESLVELMTQPFLLGELFRAFASTGIEYKTSQENFVADIFANSTIEEDAVHGEGFWIDHAFYNTDLLESYESIYPDKIDDLLFRKKILSFYDNDHVVVKRKYKYYLLDEKVRQFNSVRVDNEKATTISSRNYHKNLVRARYGRGKAYYTTLIAKILCIIVNKAASFDPEGIGLEMEAEKPDWYDALNGLPALFGSSLSETLELKRLCQYILARLTDQAVTLAAEIKDYLEAINLLLEDFLQDEDSFKYWDGSNGIKESYRAKTRLGISGQETELEKDIITGFLKKVVAKCDHGINKCLSKYNNYHTYFLHEAEAYEKETEEFIRVTKFKQTPLPLFLEGFVHALKVEKDLKIPNLVKNGPLYDKELKMYKVNASLNKAPLEIGRCKIFTPGWLENESIWLHMEYKYLLELLKAGLYDEFFGEAQNTLIPFLDPKTYKRSILENSSFLVSSANPNKDNHGRGFVARLSGACAEFIDMWVIITTGKKMFYLDRGNLCFKLEPKLPAWLFDKKGEFSFKLLGSIEVTYVNKSKKNTYDKNIRISSYQITLENGEEATIDQSSLEKSYANLIRDRKVKNITVTIS